MSSPPAQQLPPGWAAEWHVISKIGFKFFLILSQESRAPAIPLYWSVLVSWPVLTSKAPESLRDRVWPYSMGTPCPTSGLASSPHAVYPPQSKKTPVCCWPDSGLLRRRRSSTRSWLWRTWSSTSTCRRPALHSRPCSRESVPGPPNSAFLLRSTA